MSRIAAILMVILWLLNLAPSPTRSAVAVADGWEHLPGPLVTGGTVDALAAARTPPLTFYVLVAAPSGERRLFRASEDLTWELMHTFASRQRSLAVAADDPNVVYVGEDQRLRRSADGGLMWTDVFTLGQVVAAPMGDMVYAGGVVDAASVGLRCFQTAAIVARSDDNGVHWRSAAINCGTEVTALAVHPTLPDTLLVGIYNDADKRGYVALSEDGGLSWTQADLHPSSVHYVMELVYDATQPERVYLASEDGLLRSLNGGRSWHDLRDPERQPPWAEYRLAVDAAGVVYAADHHRYASEPAWLYRSDDGGETWWRALEPLPAGCGDLLANPIQPGLLYAGFQEYGVYRSDTGGSHWEERNEGLEMLPEVHAIAFDPRRAGTIYVGVTRPRGGIFRSEDGGQTWQQMIRNTPIYAIALDPAGSGYGIAGGPDGLIMTDGERWWEAYTSFDRPYTIYDVTIGPQGMSSAVAVGGEKGQGWALRYVIPSDERQMPYWQQVPIADSVYAYAIARHPKDPAILYVGGTDRYRNASVYRSADGGVTWEEIAELYLWGIDAVAVDPISGNAIYAGSPYYGLHRSVDGGETWTRWDEGLDTTASGLVRALLVDSVSVVYAGTLGGLYRRGPQDVRWGPWGLEDRHVYELARSDDVLWAGTDAGLWQRPLPLFRQWFPWVGW